MKDSNAIILGIFSIVFFSIYSHSAYAELEPLTPLELYNSSELILVGNVVSLREDSEQRETEYDIKVEQYLKNPKPYSLITVVGAGTKGAAAEDDPLFDQGDRVLLYLNKHDEKYRIRPFSFKAPLACDEHQLLQLATIPGEPRGISSPANNLIQLTNTFGTEIDTFVVNEEINIDYDLFNNNPQSNSVEVKISIMTDSSEVFHVNQIIPLEPCTNTTISWNFIPTKTGEYIVNVTSEGISTSTGFNVRLNRVEVSLDKNTVLSPLKQFKSGIPIDEIQCKENLVLVIKESNGFPACVNERSIVTLMIRSWAQIAEFEVTSGFLDHIIENAQVLSMNFTIHDCSPSIMIKINSEDDGRLLIPVPRIMVESKDGDKDDADFFVLIDGKEVDFKEPVSDMTQRTLDIPFSNGSKSIEIIKACLI